MSPLVWHRTNEDDCVSRIDNLDHVKNLENHGWELEILLLEEDDSVWKPHNEEQNIPSIIMKRTELAQPLLGIDTNPPPGLCICPGMEEFEIELN